MRGLCPLLALAFVAVAAARPKVARPLPFFGGGVGGAQPEKSNAFKYLLFSQQTTEGYCRAHTHCTEDKIRDYWTIHGLWPTNETTWPEDCDPSNKFDPNAIADFRAEMDKYWPSVTAENSDSFWEHEWSKHGTCAKEIKKLDGVRNYFSYTLELYKRWNLTSYLEQAGIFPDNEKTVQSKDIENALDEDLRGRVNIECARVSDLAHPVLTEIHFCLSKQLEVIDCPNKEQVCNEGPIYYLKTDSAPKYSVGP